MFAIDKKNSDSILQKEYLFYHIPYDVSGFCSVQMFALGKILPGSFLATFCPGWEAAMS